MIDSSASLMGLRASQEVCRDIFQDTSQNALSWLVLNTALHSETFVSPIGFGGLGDTGLPAHPPLRGCPQHSHTWEFCGLLDPAL